MSLCQVTAVAHARKPQGTCGKCGTPINVGDPYRWWKGRYTGKRIRCMARACTPTLAERETNPLRAEYREAEQALANIQGYSTDVPAEVREMGDQLRTVIDMVESVRYQLQERLDSWADTNLANSYMAQAHETTVYELEDWQSNAEGWASELEDVDLTPLEDEPDTDSDEYNETLEEIERITGEIDDLPELDLGA